MKAHNVFITGATSGIGYGIAQTLASEGHHIAFNGIADLEATLAISEKLTALGAASVHYFDADMRYGDAIRKMMSTAECSMGPIEVLINNAGIALGGPVRYLDVDIFRKQFEVNFF